MGFLIAISLVYSYRQCQCLIGIYHRDIIDITPSPLRVFELGYPPMDCLGDFFFRKIAFLKSHPTRKQLHRSQMICFIPWSPSHHGFLASISPINQLMVGSRGQLKFPIPPGSWCSIRNTGGLKHLLKDRLYDTIIDYLWLWIIFSIVYITRGTSI